MKYLMKWTPELCIAALVIIVTGAMIWCGKNSEIKTIFIAACTLAIRAAFGIKKDVTIERRNKPINNPAQTQG